MRRFPFSDLHSFKDYVGFVAICAATDFPEREGAPPAEQWTLALAFEGLREGLSEARIEKGPRKEFEQCALLFDEAYAHFEHGRVKEGFGALDQSRKLLRKIRTQ